MAERCRKINIFNMEAWRLLFIACVSPILGYFTPTYDFLYALALAFGFNVWCGMRSDGVSIIRCKNFSFSKFKNAVLELFLYLIITELIFTIMNKCGDGEAALVVVKSLTYMFIYVYMQNSFKNLVVAYPRNKVIWILYFIIRLEFKRLMPEHIQAVIDRYDKELENKNKKDVES